MLLPESLFLEHRFPVIGRIADLYWPKQKLIFEIQVSPISADEVRARNRAYQLLGLQVVWILHDRHFNRNRLTAAEIALRFSPHYFTNIDPWGRVVFYDQYAQIRFKRREKRSPRFSVRFIPSMTPHHKQLLRQLSPERKKWPLAFQGDLFHQPPGCFLSKKPSFSITQWVKNFYRIVLHMLLEKTTR